MFNYPDNNKTAEITLTLNREVITSQCIQFVLTLALTIRTYYGSKYNFVYLLCGLSMANFALNIGEVVLYNWIVFGIAQKNVTVQEQ